MKAFADISAASRLSILLYDAANANVLKKAVFSKPSDPSLVKMTATVRQTKKGAVLQCEFFHQDNKATHSNLPIDSDLCPRLVELIEGFSQINLICVSAECEYKRSRGGKEIIIGEGKLRAALSAGNGRTVEIIGNDRKKEYILDGNEEFLKLLGVSDANGRVYDKKRSKFKQINRFLELIRDVEDKLPRGRINICDLCCGKSYLSFAVYHYFANVKGYEVNMSGADLKSDVMEYCSEVSEKLGFNGLHFVCTDITKFTPDNTPDLVISLHACDTATDVILSRAVSWGAQVILSTPCCHHELNHTLNCPTLSFIADYSMLRQKFCDAATDALRLKLLESEGYSCEALELIDPEETPKNIMLRAIKKKNFSKDSPRARAALEEYRAARRFLLGEDWDQGIK